MRDIGRVLVAVTLFVLLGCSSGSGGSSSPPAKDSSATTGVVRTRVSNDTPPTTAALSVTVTTKVGTSLSDVTEARRLLEVLNLPISDDVATCVVSAATGDAQLSLGLRKKDVGSVMSAVSSCSQRLYAAPMFAEGVNRSLDGRLSKKQLMCVAEAYGNLPLDDTATLSAGAMNPKVGGAASKKILDDLLGSCDVKGR